MCGIFGFVSSGEIEPQIVVDGLRRLEYRGYDSWGVASIQAGNALQVLKSVGKISKTSAEDLKDLGDPTGLAIGHTRWATHGKPDKVNAHPHLSRTGRIAIIHNGIIENHRELHSRLEAEGYHFRSETDSEAIAHLLERELARGIPFSEAFSRTLLELRGAFGIAVIDRNQPNKLFAARMGSPLVVGIGDGTCYVSSDPSALIPHTNRVIYLDDGEWAEINCDGAATFDFHSSSTSKIAEEIDLELAATELGTFEHYMLKEIYDQPNSIRDAISGRLLHGEANVHFGGLNDLLAKWMPTRIKILACGSSWHAGLMGKQLFEELSQLPTEVEYASEFRYRTPVVEPGTLVVAISQSGETADTLAALREAKRRDVRAFGIVNVVASTIARECGRGVYLRAGPEFGVAATKSFTNQVVIMLMMAVHFGRKRGMPIRQAVELMSWMERLPELAEETLRLDEHIRYIAEKFVDAENALYIGRALEYPIALEGALKLKEVSYIHAEGLPAAELKHGPIALISPQMPTIVIATQSFILDKIASNVQEIKARGGKIITIVSEETHEFDDVADHVIKVPHAHDLVSPILACIPTQLLAYHLAVLRNCDVDQPRNLAKSVTVE